MQRTNKFPVTAAGYSALQKELQHRAQVERVHLVERLQQAIADDANLAENSEYQAAQAERQINEAHIAELEEKLARAEIIDPSTLSGEIVQFGATVTLIDEETGDQKVLQIVGEPEADARKGTVSVASPIARALIGKARGTTVVVDAPRSAKTYKILQVKWLHHHLEV